MSGFLNVIKKNLGLGGSKQAGEAKDSTATAKPAKKSKGSAYFLELDDAKGSGTTNTAATPATAEPAAQAKSTSKAEPAKAESAQVVAEPGANGKKPTAKKAEASNKKAEAKAKPDTKAATSAPVAAKPATPAVKQATTFAPEYLMSPNSYSGRRRPGANMSYFLNLASQAKTPNQ